jgi:hypothetical protein
LGDDVKARACHVESLALFRKLKDRGAAAYVLSFFADFMLAAEHAPAAAALQGFMMAVLTELAIPLDLDDLARYDGTAKELRSTMGEAAYKRAFDEGGALTLDQAAALALDHT